MSAVDQHSSQHRTVGVKGPGRIAGLDGLRAVAVVAVMLFHTAATPLQGGFLGVDVFFVLSGFLIAGILLEERQRTGGIALGAFWLRRARRLAPALLLLLVAVGVARLAVPHPDPADGRAQILAALTYTTNWFQIASGSDYFSQFGQSQPLMHTWSLAIEEQFYLFFAVLMAVLLRRVSTRTTMTVFVGLIVVSAAWMSALSQANPVWAYYATTTRVQALLVGAVLAVLVRRSGRRQVSGGRAFSLAGWVGGAVLAACFISPLSNEMMFRGGFLLVAVASAMVILGILQGGTLASLLSWRPLVALGTISYGVYLWHWPVFLLLGADDSGGPGWMKQVWAFVLTVVVAAASYFCLEGPVRQGRFVALPPARQWAVYGIASAGVALLALLPARTPEGPEQIVWPQASEVPARVLIGGDSAMFALNKYFPRDLYPDTLADGPVSLGCGFMEIPFSRKGGVELTEKCRGWQDAWRQKVNEVDPQVSFIGSTVWDSFDRLVGDVIYAPGTPGFDQPYIAAYRQAIALAGRNGQIPVYVAGQPCMANSVDPMLNEPLRARKLDELTRAAVAGMPNAYYFETRSFTCASDGTALGVAERRRLRDDGVHWNQYGAQVFWSLALSEMVRDQRATPSVPPTPEPSK